MQNPYEQIANLIRSGNKIEAIKLLRDTTGIGLKEAKDEIERLAAGLTGEVPPPAEESTPTFPYEKVAELVRHGRKIEAVKLVREQTGLGLKEAKEQVDAITGVRQAGCARTLAVVVVAVMILITVLIITTIL